MTRFFFPQLLALLMLVGFSFVFSGCSDEDITETTGAKIATDSTQITFQRVALGELDLKSLVVSNVGTGPLVVKSIVWDGTKDITLKYIGDVPENLTLDPSGDYEIGIVYAPSDGEPDSGNIIIVSNDGQRPILRIPVVTPDAGARLQVVPDRNTGLRFDAVEIGQSETKTVSLTNVGFLPLSVTNIRIEGSDDFVLTLPDGVTIDGDGYIIKDSTVQLGVEITYNPKTLGGDSAELLIDSNDGTNNPYILPIIANSETACIRVSERFVELQNVRIGSEEARTVVIENCGGVDLEIRGLSKAPGGSGEIASREATPLEGKVIPPEESTTFDIIYTPIDEGAPDSAEFIISSNDPLQSELSIEVLATATSNECPIAEVQARTSGQPSFERNNIIAAPLDTLILDASRSFDSESAIEDYNWTITKRPDGSTTEIEKKADGRAELYLVLIGTYEVCLEVIDGSGIPSCFEDCIEIEVVPNKKITVQLLWQNALNINVEDGFGPDIDIHFLRLPQGSWAETDRPMVENKWDVFFLNRAPSGELAWDIGDGTTEHPSLDKDDRSGDTRLPDGTTQERGEQVTLDDPGACAWYAIGIHYYSDGGFFDEITYARATFSANGGRIGEMFNVPLSLAGETTGDFWTLGLILWDGDNGHFFETREKFEQGGWKGMVPAVSQEIRDFVAEQVPQCAGTP